MFSHWKAHQTWTKIGNAYRVQMCNVCDGGSQHCLYLLNVKSCRAGWAGIWGPCGHQAAGFLELRLSGARWAMVMHPPLSGLHPGGVFLPDGDHLKHCNWWLYFRAALPGALLVCFTELFRVGFWDSNFQKVSGLLFTAQGRPSGWVLPPPAEVVSCIFHSTAWFSNELIGAWCFWERGCLYFLFFLKPWPRPPSCLPWNQGFLIIREESI